MKWTIANPPPPAANASKAEKEACVAAANAALEKGASETDAILKGVRAMRDARNSTSNVIQLNTKTPLGLQVYNRGEELEMHLYGDVGPSFFGGVSAADFAGALRDHKNSNIHLRINSPGGDVFEGFAIYNLLRQHKGRVTCHIDSLCASIATIISLAAEETVMAEEGYYMIHAPWVMAMGNADDLKETIERLEGVHEQMINVYERHTGLSRDELDFMMREETWMTPQQALDLGFVSSLYQEDQRVAAMFTEKSKKWFAKAPTSGKLTSAKKRLEEQEKALHRLSK